MIMRGAMLDDPAKKLDGKGASTRNYRIKTLEDFDKKYFKSLIQQQAKLYASGIRWEG